MAGRDCHGTWKYRPGFRPVFYVILFVAYAMERRAAYMRTFFFVSLFSRPVTGSGAGLLVVRVA